MVKWRQFGRWIGTGLTWILILLVGAGMWDSGLGKFTSADGWQHWMTDVWGYPSWFRVFVGVAEAGGGVLLFIPAAASYAASGLAVIMLGAFWTVTTKPADLSPEDPVVLAVLCVILAAVRWRHRYRFRRSTDE